MKDPEHPHYMWGAGTSEVDGRWLELYTRRDTARVCTTVSMRIPCVPHLSRRYVILTLVSLGWLSGRIGVYLEKHALVGRPREDYDWTEHRLDQARR